MRAIACLAVAMTFAATASLADPMPSQEQSATTSTISKSNPPPSPAESAPSVNSAIPETGASGSPTAEPENSAPSAKSIAAAIANPSHRDDDLKALHDPALREKLHETLRKFDPERERLDREYRQAAAIFPSFCKDWERKLREREVNNIQHIVWRLENGYQTAIYTGYGPIESCETHQSPQGFSIGKITYEEYHYLIRAKTVEEAKHTKATPVDDTHTTEIFRWEKGQWFY